MLDNLVLSISEKIKKLRVITGATQQDISSDDLTRQQISNIEKGKFKKIPPKTIEIIARNFNSFIISKELDVEPITVDFLLEDESTQITRITNKYISDLLTIIDCKNKELILSKLNELKNFIDHYKISEDKHIEIFIIESRAYKNLYMFKESKISILEGMNLAIVNNNIECMLELIMLLTLVNIRLKEYDSIPALCDYALSISKAALIKKTDNLKFIIYNAAYSYRKKNDNQNSIKYLEILIENVYLSDKEKIDVYNLIGKDLLKLRRFEESEKMFLKAKLKASQYGDISEKIMVLINLCLLYIETGQREEAISIADLLENIKYEVTDTQKLTDRLYYIVIIETLLDREKKVEELYINTFDLSVKLNNDLMQYKLVTELYKYFVQKNSISNIELLSDIIIKNIKNEEFMLTEINQKLINILYLIADFIKDINKHKSNIIINTANEFYSSNYLNESYEI